MSDTSSTINRVRFDSAVTTSSADVVVKGFSNNALQGILEAISKTNSVISGLQSRLDDIQSSSDRRERAEEQDSKNAEKNRVASLASERRSRATDEAIHGEIKRGNIFNKMLRDGLMEALNGLTSFLKENLNKALKTQQDLAATMRKANLSTDEKNKIQDLAIQMKSIVKSKFDGLDVSNEQIKDYMSDLMAAGKDITRMSQSELAGYIAMRRRNIESEKAYDLAKTASENSIKQLTLSMGDNQVAGSVGKIMAGLDANVRAAMGGTDSALSQVSDIAKQLEAKAGGVLDSDEVAEIATLLIKKQNLNMIGGEGALSEQDKAMLAAGGNAATVDEFIDNLAKNSNIVTSSLKTLPASVARIREASQNGHEIGKVLKTDDQIREANKTNTVEGKLPSLFEDVFNSTLGKITGPLSTWVDEMFGGSTDIVSIVSTGFKFVVGLLGSIAASKLIGGNPLSLLKTGIGNLLPGLTKGFGKVLSVLFNPMTLAIGAAAASVGYAVYKISDAYDRLNRPDEVKKDIAANNNEIAEAESRLETVKKYGTPEEIKQVEAKLASLKAKGESLKADLEQANEDAKSESEKNSDKYSKEQTEVMKNFINEANLAQRIAMRARQAGDEETYEKEMARHAALMEQADKTREQMRIVDEESRGLLASTFDLSPDTLLGWHNFKDTISNFFTKSIPEFFTETIPNALTSAGKWVWDKISSFGRSVYGLFDEYVLTPISNAFSWQYENIFTPIGNFFSEIGTFISENFIDPISGFFDTIGNFIDENFVQPVKSFFDFKWLPEPVYKFMFDEDYGAADMAGDLAGAAIDKGKELLDGAANAISEGVDFVKGLWPFADGGIVNQATPAVVGEDGKEAILPLEKPDQLLSVLNKLTENERADILKSILSSNNFSIDNLSSTLMKIADSGTKSSAVSSSLMGKIGGPVPGDDPATINRILSMAGQYRNLVLQRLNYGWKGQYKKGNAFEQRKKWYDEALQNASNQEGRELIRGTYAERALDYGVSELGKPYILRSLGKIGYVCNELVNACLRASGFDMKKFNFWGVNATLQEFRKGKYSNKNKYPDFRLRPDLTPETALPGMIFFQGTKKNDDGSFAPGHIGLVYYGHQKLHASGGSANFSKNGFLPNWQTPCRGVTVTPFNAGPQYLIGEFPDLFRQANGEFKLPEGANFGPAAVVKDSSGKVPVENQPPAPAASEAKIPAIDDSFIDSIFKSGGFLTAASSAVSLSNFISKFIGGDQATAEQIESNSLAREYIEAVKAVRNSSSDEAKQAAAQFSKTALQLLGNKSSSPEILAALNSMIKYLRDIASSPANKKAIPSVSRPVSTSY